MIFHCFFLRFYCFFLRFQCFFSDFFDARRESGRVYVKKNLVRHTGTYLFYVQATDNLGSGCTRNTSVKVIVNPSANAPPVWVIPPVDNMTIYVLEVIAKTLLGFKAAKLLPLFSLL